ncbi:MAG: hypothetical protein QXY73_00885 [Candidatus Bathyarchaeia archaeon]
MPSLEMVEDWQWRISTWKWGIDIFQPFRLHSTFIDEWMMEFGKEDIIVTHEIDMARRHPNAVLAIEAE